MLRNLDRIGVKGIVYDGKLLSENFIVRTLRMPITAPVDANTMTIDGKPGAWFVGKQIGTRTITIGLGVLGQSSSHQKMIENWLENADSIIKDEVKKLEFGNGMYAWAMYTGTSDIMMDGKWSIVELTFECFDPYIYGETHEVPLKTGDNTFEVLGKACTYPIITTTGATSETVKNVTSGKVTKVTGLTSNTKVVFDMAEHKCTVNGAYKPADPTVSDFWYMNPGNVTINLSGGSGTLVYEERYL